MKALEARALARLRQHIEASGDTLGHFDSLPSNGPEVFAKQNPFQSPTTASSIRRRRTSWVGIALIVVTLALYGPMTVVPLLSALRGEEVGLMLLAAAFNGIVFLGLLWLGRWLCKRARAESASTDSSAGPTS